MSLEVKIKKRLDAFLLDVDFSCEGEPTAVLGASGSGKSMTLKCIAGIERPDEGRIVLNGRVLFDSEAGINLPTQKRNVGYLFQNYALFPNMTVEQNIACGLYSVKDKQVRMMRVHEMIEKMQLSGLEKHKPNQLSGGQQQRVALARILIGNPEILMLDEPFSALDRYLRDQLLSEVKKLLTDYKKDVLMVTHDHDEACVMCSRLVIMNQGHICNQGKTKDVFADPKTVPGAVLTGCKNIYKAHKVGETKIEIPELGVVIEMGRSVEDHLCAAGFTSENIQLLYSEES